MGLKFRNKQYLIIAAYFLAVIAIQLHFSTEGWNNSIGGPQDFRQTQTAIASYYVAEEGPTLATKIPVLGPNWYNPFEFPTYQTIVAGLHKLTGIPLDQAGRLVSLLSFYLCLLPLSFLLRQIGFSKADIPFVLALVISSPVYIFWSRTFLIETIALLLSLLFAVTVLKYRENPRAGILVAALICGCFAALTKFTTFSIIFGFLILFLGSRCLNKDVGIQWLREKKTVSGIALAFFIPVLAGWIWVQYVQNFWLLSPLTRGSGEFIHQWNFGDWDLRDSPDFWGRFYQYSIGKITYNFIPWLIGIAAFTVATFRYRVIGLCALAAWLSGPLVWANLFYVHDYYCVETGLFALIFISACIVGAADRWPFLAIPSRVLLSFLAMGFLAFYPRTSYFEAQVYDWGEHKMKFSREVGERLPDDQILLIIGDDWNPMIAYYAKQYAIMVRWKGHSLSPEFEEALQLIEDEGRVIGGAVVRSGNPEMEPETNQLFDRFGISSNSEFTSHDNEYQFYSTTAK